MTLHGTECSALCSTLCDNDKLFVMFISTWNIHVRNRSLHFVGVACKCQKIVAVKDPEVRPFFTVSLTLNGSEPLH